VLHCQFDLSLLTRRHDFVIVAFGASSARGDAVDQEIGFTLVFDLEGIAKR
jgi:hypothetical protein